MSSGRLHSMGQGREAEEAAVVRWLPVGDLTREETPLDGMGSLHWRVELPSRRMYIEAVGHGHAAE